MGKHIVVVGDVMLDRTVYGNLRLSPEGPLFALTESEQKNSPGGAGNVARNLAALGAEVTLLGVVGSDTEGEVVRAAWANADVVPVLVIDSDRPTTLKMRFYDEISNRQLFRYDRERIGALSGSVSEELFTALKGLTKVADAVLLSDYGKGVISTLLIRPDVLRFLKQAVTETPTLLQLKPRNKVPAAQLQVGVVTNRTEAAEIIGVAPVSSGMLTQFLRIDTQWRFWVMTEGEAGAVAVTRDTSYFEPTPEKVRLYDPGGAGDTFTAAFFLTFLATEGDFRKSLKAGHRAALEVVKEPGIEVASIPELLPVEVRTFLST